MVKGWIFNLTWACDMEGDFSLISRKDIPALSCKDWDCIRTGDPTIILLQLGTKSAKASQEMTKNEMNSNGIVWILKPLDFVVLGPNKFNFA